MVEGKLAEERNVQVAVVETARGPFIKLLEEDGVFLEVPPSGEGNGEELGSGEEDGDGDGEAADGEDESPGGRGGGGSGGGAPNGEREEITFEDWLPALQRAAEWSDQETLIQLAGHFRGRALQEWTLLRTTEKDSMPAGDSSHAQPT